MKTLALILACGLLTACATTTPPFVDLPDLALVTPCDVTERPVSNNEDVANELINTRTQRDDCAAKVGALGQWRSDAVKRTKP